MSERQCISSRGGETAEMRTECKVLRCSVAITDVEVGENELWLFDIFFWTCAVLVVVVGSPLACLIVHYEWYGGDAQKRSLVNRQAVFGRLIHKFPQKNTKAL